MHRVVGIGDEIHDDLVELMGIRPERRKIVGQVEADVDVVDPQRVGEQLHRFSNDLIGTHQLPLRRMLTGQRQEVAHDPHASLRGGGDPVETLPERAVAERLTQDRAVPGHDRQRVVQLMCDAGEECPHIGELVALDAGGSLAGQLVLDPATLGDIA
jgi:hypothetical protein